LRGLCCAVLHGFRESIISLTISCGYRGVISLTKWFDHPCVFGKARTVDSSGPIPLSSMCSCIAFILFVRPVLTIPWNGSGDLKLLIVAASRRRSCCLPRRRRRWTRLCGRSSQREGRVIAALQRCRTQAVLVLALSKCKPL